MVFIYGVPTRIKNGSTKSIPVALFDDFLTKRAVGIPSTFITAGSQADVEGYIDRLANVPSNRINGILLQGPSAATDYYFDERHSARPGEEFPDRVARPLAAHKNLLEASFTPDPTITYSDYSGQALLSLNNPRGYQSWGLYNSSIGRINKVPPGGEHNIVNVSIPQSQEGEGGAWYAMSAIVSYTGRLNGSSSAGEQAGYDEWFSKGAFQSSTSNESYLRSPIVAVATTEEPKIDGTIGSQFWRLWENDDPFICAAWAGRRKDWTLPIGDPFVTK